MNTASGIRGLGVEEVAVLEVRIGVATRTRGEGCGRLQVNELAADEKIKDEVAPGKNSRITPRGGSLSAVCDKRAD